MTRQFIAGQDTGLVISSNRNSRLFDPVVFDFVSINTREGQHGYFPQTTSIKYDDHKYMKQSMSVDSSDD